jgi:hypothetical protein
MAFLYDILPPEFGKRAIKQVSVPNLILSYFSNNHQYLRELNLKNPKWRWQSL